MLQPHDDLRSSLMGDAVHGLFLLSESIEDCNFKACDLWGYTRDGIIGKTLQDLSPDAQADGALSQKLLEARIQAARAGLPQSFEWRFRRNGGEIFDSIVSLECCGINGRLLGRVRDVSYLNRAENALRESETRLQQILNNATAVIYVKDREGRYLFVNRQFERLFQVCEADILSKPDHQVFPEAVADTFRRNDLTVFRQNTAMEFEETALLADGQHTYISIKFPLFNTEGVTYAVCGISTDITERKRTEEALRNVALGVSGAIGGNIFRELVRYLAITLDVEFAYIGKLIEGSCERVRTLAVYDRGQFLGNVEYNLAGTPCEKVVGKQFEYIPVSVQERFPGDTLLQQLGFSSYAAYPLFDSQGQALGLIVVTDRKPLRDRNVTEAMLKIFSVRAAAELERFQLEAQLRQAQKMEAIGHLTGGIAHDFNNILTGTMGYMVLAMERAEPYRDTKLGKYLERAYHSGQRARDLIQQMLTFSRGQRGEPRPLSLQPLIKESVKLLGATLPSTVELQLALDPEIPQVMLDPVQIEQILMNLCINARDAMNASGRIEVGLHSVTYQNRACTSCHQTVAGHFVEIAVRDTGPGILPEHIDRIFEPFFTTKETGKGSGMGLSTVHGIVHEYGGHIIVHTAMGEGTEFQVLFIPLAPVSAEAQVSLPAETNAAGKTTLLHGKVLVVDDDEIVGEFMEELLASWGLDAMFINSGIKARDLLVEDSKCFDLVVLDQTMPRITGLELAKHLLALQPDLPVIVYTGYSENLSAEQVQSAGVRALIRKPVDADELYTLVKNLLSTPVKPPLQSESDPAVG